jgi:predicted RNA-binding Zn-ribbon protein involved in translation (DUF1610 family)
MFEETLREDNHQRGITLFPDNKCRCGGNLSMSKNKRMWICDNCGKIITRFKEKRKPVTTMENFSNPTHRVVERIFLKPFGHTGDIIEDIKTNKLYYYSRRSRIHHFHHLGHGWGISAILIKMLLDMRVENIVLEVVEDNIQIITNIDNYILKKTDFKDPRITDQKLALNYIVNERFFKIVHRKIIFMGY